jgi:hypothetical protein
MPNVARCYIFKPEIPIWVYLEGLEMEDASIFNCHLVHFTAIWYILLPFGIYYIRTAIWYILWPFGIFWFWVYFSRIGKLWLENMATLPGLFVYR